jgi:hypothetical protein
MCFARVGALTVSLLLLALFLAAGGGEGGGRPAAADPPPGKVYGEWRIRPRPDKGTEYNQLIAEKGLPLFREAGGRMVGWWTTLVGDLYEHVTIWEYDGMGSFEKAVGFLGKDERFARFVALRDPLLAGEESRFLRLAGAAERPELPARGRFVIHEVHRVPLTRREAYMSWIQRVLPALRKLGFRPTGPFSAEIGRWSEVTYLFGYESLAERERLIAELGASPEGRAYSEKLQELVEEVTTRLLVPTPFAR